MSIVNEVEELHQELLQQYPDTFSIVEFLDRQAHTLFKEHQQGNTAVYGQISNWFPPLAGATRRAILERPFSLDEARLTIAREYGFANWKQVAALGEQRVDEKFETAVNAIISGNLEQLQTLLQQSPHLSQQKSPYGHQATLLHYVAANGVEIWRQKVPGNAVVITRTLLQAGSDVEAKANVYGGQYNTMALLQSSAHPAAAGLTESIAQVLREASSSA